MCQICDSINFCHCFRYRSGRIPEFFGQVESVSGIIFAVFGTGFGFFDVKTVRQFFYLISYHSKYSPVLCSSLKISLTMNKIEIEAA
jgi:hypothetical protein